MVPARAADGIPYIDRSWDESASTVSSEEKTCDTYTTVSNSMDTNWGTGWYVVPENADVTIGSRITVSGSVNLILCDGAKLTASGGITVKGGDSLTIYAQSDGETMGALTATGGNSAAGIGGGWKGSGGTVTVNGGFVTATGGKSGAGIGGGNGGQGGG